MNNEKKTKLVFEARPEGRKRRRLRNEWGQYIGERDRIKSTQDRYLYRK